ncbi:MAG: cytochrome c [Candidatus Solibacter usitatus]|nr:cytochrome c [Candidatus Solibacter usitatus]
MRIVYSALLTACLAGVAFAGDGKAVYDKSCKSCHGADGAGNPAIAKMMKITFKHLGSKEVQVKKDAELKGDITKGTGKMKPVASLSPAQVDDVVAYLRTLKQ